MQQVAKPEEKPVAAEEPVTVEKSDAGPGFGRLKVQSLRDVHCTEGPSCKGSCRSYSLQGVKVSNGREARVSLGGCSQKCRPEALPASCERSISYFGLLALKRATAMERQQAGGFGMADVLSCEYLHLFPPPPAARWFVFPTLAFVWGPW